MNCLYKALFLVLFLTGCGSPAYAFSRTTSEKRPKVVVIDTGLNLQDPRFSDVLCHGGHRDFTGTGIQDDSGHGTHVAGIIMHNAPDHSKYCLVIVKVFKGGNKVVAPVNAALIYAEQIGASVINASFSGAYGSEEERAILSASKAKIVVAAGNDSTYYKNAYPGGYGISNVYAVGDWDCDNSKRSATSNWGEGVFWRCGTHIKSTLPFGKEGFMSGTSMAAPLYTAELINEEFK